MRPRLQPSGPVLLLSAALACAWACACAPSAGSPSAPVVAHGSARPAHWGYEGDIGPAHWASLSPAYAACAGLTQSPIDIRAAAVVARHVRFDYQTSKLRIAHHQHVDALIDNGHTIQVSIDEGSTLTTDQGSFALKQFHFHTPSEHTLDGQSFPMEAHFVHQSAEGKFAVVAIFFSEGAANPQLEQLIQNFPAAPGESLEPPKAQLDLALHVPQQPRVYTYSGSFTTPPCTPDVAWLLFEQPLTAGATQLAAFAQRLGANNRPIQPLAHRSVQESPLDAP